MVGMTISEFLKSNNLTAMQYAVKIGVHFTILYRAMAGKGTNIENAHKIIAGSDGLITLDDLKPSKNRAA
jgi:predicted transcriptional regulator